MLMMIVVIMMVMMVMKMIKLSNVWSSTPTPILGSSISLTTAESSLQGPSGPSFKSPAEKRQLMCSWVEDSTVVSCMICGTDFTFFTRRYVVVIMLSSS